MLSKSKLKKLNEQFKSLGISQKDQGAEAGVSREMIARLYRGEYYKREVVLALIALREKRRKELSEIAAAI